MAHLSIQATPQEGTTPEDLRDYLVYMIKHGPLPSPGLPLGTEINGGRVCVGVHYGDELIAFNAGEFVKQHALGIDQLSMRVTGIVP